MAGPIQTVLGLEILLGLVLGSCCVALDHQFRHATTNNLNVRGQWSGARQQTHLRRLFSSECALLQTVLRLDLFVGLVLPVNGSVRSGATDASSNLLFDNEAAKVRVVSGLHLVAAVTQMRRPILIDSRATDDSWNLLFESEAPQVSVACGLPPAAAVQTVLSKRVRVSFLANLYDTIRLARFSTSAMVVWI